MPVGGNFPEILAHIITSPLQKAELSLHSRIAAWQKIRSDCFEVCL
jgi:hypothetical protein